MKRTYTKQSRRGVGGVGGRTRGEERRGEEGREEEWRGCERIAQDSTAGWGIEERRRALCRSQQE